eukprot:tig00021590_g22779.t1
MAPLLPSAPWAALPAMMGVLYWLKERGAGVDLGIFQLSAPVVGFIFWAATAAHAGEAFVCLFKLARAGAPLNRNLWYSAMTFVYGFPAFNVAAQYEAELTTKRAKS